MSETWIGPDGREWVSAAPLEGDPFGIQGTHTINVDPDAARSLMIKLGLLNSVVSWMVVEHPDEIPAFIRRWCAEPDEVAPMFADALRQLDVLREHLGSDT